MTIKRRHFLSAGIGLAGSIALSGGRHTFAQSPDNFEFAIVGAGLFGSAAARHLSTMSDSVVLIGPGEPESRRDHQGVFASHYDASRLVRGIDPDLLWATLAKRSIGRYRNIEKASGIDFYQDIGYMMVTPGGLGEDWFNLPAMREVAADLGVSIEDLTGDQLNDRFPFLEFTPGSSAILQPRNAGYVNPRNLKAAQQKVAASQGTTIMPDIVTRIQKHGSQVEIATGNGATL
ncbi:MAG: NAD(P)/FAD-dependent oxidoreductase, partial [Woeseiaceae bacterium]